MPTSTPTGISWLVRDEGLVDACDAGLLQVRIFEDRASSGHRIEISRPGGILSEELKIAGSLELARVKAKRRLAERGVLAAQGGDE